MYNQDSFFDLTPLGQIGLACVSAVLFTVTVYVAWRLLRNFPVWVRPVGSLVLFYVFVWVSPQVYFQYYHLLFEFLPDQWVIFPPPSPVKAIEFLTFSGPQTLSAHGQGLLGWVTILAPFVKRRVT
jgi:hypothetical protein